MSIEPTCTKCGAEYDSLEEGFHKSENLSRGYLYRCKTCIRDIMNVNNHKRAWIKIEIELEQDRKRERDRMKKNRISDKKAAKLSKIAYSFKSKYIWTDVACDWMDSPERTALVNSGEAFCEEREILTNQIIYKLNK